MKPNSGLRWWIVFGLIGPITFVMNLDRTAMVIAAPTIRSQYGFSLVEMGVILTSFSWTYALFQIPTGWLAGKLGPRRALMIANIFWSVLTALTPLGRGVASFIGIRTLLGAGQAMDWPASIIALKRWFPARERGKGNSVLLGALYLGPVAAAPVITQVIIHFGWQWAFYGFGLLGLVLGIIWWIGFRDDPATHPLITPEEAALISAGQPIETEPETAGLFVRSLRTPQFWALGVQYFFLILLQGFFNTWLPTYLVSERHMTLAQMGIYASFPWMTLFVMVFVGGWIADAVLRRTGSVWAARVPAAMIGFIVSAAALIGASRVPGIGPMVALLCVSLGAIGLVQVSIWSSCQDLARGATGALTGWTNCWGNSSAFVGPIITAYLVQLSGSWEGPLLAMALAGSLGSILWLFVHPERPMVLQDVKIPVAART